MFLISDANLVASVCEAGGTGAFPALNFRPVTRFREEVVKIQERTDKAFGVNLIVQSSNRHLEEQLEACVELRVPYIITSLGNPREVIEKAHAVGTKVFCDVTNGKHAQKAVDAGADGLIAVCSGAGGHSGTVSAFALIPYLRREFGLPVIAAGSIANGEGMLAALALGASGVYMGTRFIACEEADAPREYKETIVREGFERIINTDRVDGFPGNFIETEGFRRLLPEPGVVEKILQLNPRFKRWHSLYKASQSLLGDPEKVKATYKTVYSAGHGLSLINEIQSAGEIVQAIMQEYDSARARLP